MDTGTVTWALGCLPSPHTSGGSSASGLSGPQVTETLESEATDKGGHYYINLDEVIRRMSIKRKQTQRTCNMRIHTNNEVSLQCTEI